MITNRGGALIASEADPLLCIADRNKVGVLVSVHRRAQRTFSARPDAAIFVSEKLIFLGEPVGAVDLYSAEMGLIFFEIIQARSAHVTTFVRVRFRVFDGPLGNYRHRKDRDPPRF